MSDVMRPILFESLLKRIFQEYSQGSIFGILKENFYRDKRRHTAKIFSQECTTVLGPAAGPHTQLAQNIITSYLTGSRFIELKTVQIMDRLDIAKPCIDARDEGYNVEWSTEYTLTKARDEYYKAWVVCNLLDALMHGGDWQRPTFIFNMSVGYNMEGILTSRMQEFIDKMMDASSDPKFQSYLGRVDEIIESGEYFKGTDFQRSVENLKRFGKFSSLISANICRSVTLSTMHGCPPSEIESICSYMLREKNIDTFVKLNPTLLGFRGVREILEKTGFGYVKLSLESFEHDLQYTDAISMLKRLFELSKERGRNFGIKLTNTLGNINNKGQLPGDEMYMSGRSLFPIATALAAKISREFDGMLPISFSGGVNIFNVLDLFKTGIRPITMATDMLHPGGYNKMTEMAKLLDEQSDDWFEKSSIDVEAIERLSLNALSAPYCQKSFRGYNSVKAGESLPVTDCFVAPCQEACPVHQNIPAYIKQAQHGKEGTLNAMYELYDCNALPNITCAICDHKCQNNCTRLDYEGKGVQIRGMKKYSVDNAWQDFENANKGVKVDENNIRVAVVGAGPSGLATAIFLREFGYDVTVFEKEAQAGGVVKYIIPEFRIDKKYVDNDYSHALNIGVKFAFNCSEDRAKLDNLKREGFERVFYCVGCSENVELDGMGDDSRKITAVSFLRYFNEGRTDINFGENVVVIGGGNTAMDAARAALRIPGVRSSTILYRKTEEDMPADKEEIELAKADGVNFIFLGTPKEHKNGILKYMQMRTCGRDEKGRNITYGTDKDYPIRCDFIIMALGQKTDANAIKNLGLHVDDKGRAVVNKTTFETDIENVYLVGDAASGPSTVIKCVASARSAVDSLFYKDYDKIKIENDNDNDSVEDSEVEYYKVDESDLKYIKDLRKNHCKVLTSTISETDPSFNEKVGESCLDCETYCGKCVDVCPNRANVVIDVSSEKYTSIFENLYQIVHVDAYCNECGNCSSFCPYTKGRPYKDKFTIFSTYDDLRSSTNDGFYIYQGKAYIRDQGKAIITNIKKGNVESKEVRPEYRALISIICNNYSYLLTKVEEN